MQPTLDMTPSPDVPTQGVPAQPTVDEKPRPAEIGGPQGPEPTRYGDWERKGRCIDF